MVRTFTGVCVCVLWTPTDGADVVAVAQEAEELSLRCFVEAHQGAPVERKCAIAVKLVLPGSRSTILGVSVLLFDWLVDGVGVQVVFQLHGRRARQELLDGLVITTTPSSPAL